MNERREMLVAVSDEFEGHLEPLIVVADAHLVLTGLKHGVERRALPVLRGLALAGRSIFERVAFVRFDVAPAEALALEDGMQRVDENEAARQIDAGRPGAFAELAHKVGFRDAGEARTGQPVHDLKA